MVAGDKSNEKKTGNLETPQFGKFGSTTYQYLYTVLGSASFKKKSLSLPIILKTEMTLIVKVISELN